MADFAPTPGSRAGHAIKAILNLLPLFTSLVKGLVPKSGGGTTNFLRADGTWAAPAGSGLTVLRSYLAGLGLSMASNTVVGIAAGVAADSANAVMMTLSAFQKSTAGAWTSGSGNNGMGNGLTIANSTWYHVILANNGGTPDVYLDTSATGANIPTGITDTKVRRIGSFLTDGSAHIIAFSQNGDEFLWNVPVGDVNVTNLGTAATSYTLSVPLGVVVNAIGNLKASQALAGNVMLASSLAVASQAADTPTGNEQVSIVTAAQPASSTFNIRTNTSSQIRAIASGANTTLQVATWGWIDRRGRDA